MHRQSHERDVYNIKNIKVKKLFFIIILVINGLLSVAQTDSVKLAAKTDSLYLAEMISRREINPATGEIKVDCPVLGNPLRSIHISKYISKSKSAYCVTLIVRDTIYKTNSKGVKIFFTDATRFDKPEQRIITEISDISNIYDDFRKKYKYQYTATFTLTPADLKILSSKIISKFRLSDFEAGPNSKDAEDFMIYCRNIVMTK